MILDTVTKTLELVLGSAVTTTAMPVTVDYVDMTTTTTLSGSSDSQSNGVTLVTILAAPAASTQRKVNALTVYNADTVAKVVTIRLNNNTVLRNLVVLTLQVGETLGYSDTGGWYVLTSAGTLKEGTVTAIEIVNVPAGNIAATTVQAALNELDTEKALLAGSVAQIFSVATATAATHAVNKTQMETADALRALLAGSSGQNFAANVLTLATVLATASGGNGHALGSMNQLLRSTTDWNTATTAGRYVAQGVSNAPSGITDWLNVTVDAIFDGNTLYLSQVGVTVTAGAYMFHRVCIAGTWSAWKTITAV